MQFLSGLNDQYNNIISHVLLMDPISFITKIFSLVVQQELASSYPISNFNIVSLKHVNLLLFVPPVVNLVILRVHVLEKLFSQSRK